MMKRPKFKPPLPSSLCRDDLPETGGLLIILCGAIVIAIILGLLL